LRQKINIFVIQFADSSFFFLREPGTLLRPRVRNLRSADAPKLGSSDEWFDFHCAPNWQQRGPHR